MWPKNLLKKDLGDSGPSLTVLCCSFCSPYIQNTVRSTGLIQSSLRKSRRMFWFSLVPGGLKGRLMENIIMPRDEKDILLLRSPLFKDRGNTVTGNVHVQLLLHLNWVKRPVQKKEMSQVRLSQGDLIKRDTTPPFRGVWLHTREKTSPN